MATEPPGTPRMALSVPLLFVAPSDDPQALSSSGVPAEPAIGTIAARSSGALEAAAGSEGATGAGVSEATAGTDGAHSSGLLRMDAAADLQRSRPNTEQAFCTAFLMTSCFAAMGLIVSEAVHGIQRSFYCETRPHKVFAPLVCVVPLGSAATLCHMAVVLGLFCIAQFAWRSRGMLDNFAEVEQHRAQLRADLKSWRSMSAKVLLVAGVIYLFIGAPCAGLARIAFVFLATGFLTLYATVLFFDDDFEQTHVRLSPRLFRFLGVYTLVGLTFTALSAGMVEWLGGHPRLPPYAASSNSSATVANRSTGGLEDPDFGDFGHDAHHGDSPPYRVACSSAGRKELSPPSCTVPLDLAAGASLWWAASPLFSMLVGSPRSGPGGTTDEGSLRRILQRWRRRLDYLILAVTGVLMLLLRTPCQHDAPVAFGNALLGVWTVSLLVLFRRASPDCDGWRGPLEHLAAPPISAPLLVPQCSVCLMDMRPSEDLCRAPCGHDFHRDCLEDWVLSRRYRSPDCPLCREHLDVPDRSADVWRASNVL